MTSLGEDEGEVGTREGSEAKVKLPSDFQERTVFLSRQAAGSLKPTPTAQDRGAVTNTARLRGLQPAWRAWSRADLGAQGTAEALTAAADLTAPPSGQGLRKVLPQGTVPLLGLPPDGVPLLSLIHYLHSHCHARGPVAFRSLIPHRAGSRRCRTMLARPPGFAAGMGTSSRPHASCPRP